MAKTLYISEATSAIIRVFSTGFDSWGVELSHGVGDGSPSAGLRARAPMGSGAKPPEAEI